MRRLRPLFLVSFLSLPLSGVATSSAPPSLDGPPKGDSKSEPSGFAGRTGKGKARLLKEFGGTEASEEAVMLGLAWLTQKQKKNGSWAFDGAMPEETAAATGLALLSFLGAGQSHQAGRYRETVKAGLDWLIQDVDQRGRFRGFRNQQGMMYSQGIATLALCEAYGLTRDRAILPAAQAAIDYIQSAQARDGSWGYFPNDNRGLSPSGRPYLGDTSIAGWEIQALHAALLTNGDLRVDPRVIKKAVEFLDICGVGPRKSMYGYMDSEKTLDFGAPRNLGPVRPDNSVTAICLLSRYYIDGWRDTTPGFAEGVRGLMRRAPAPQNRPQFDMYFYYYATQVVRFHGGEEWHAWNEGPRGEDGARKGGVHDWLISLQDRGSAQRGSWPPEEGREGRIGVYCGRVGTTCLCLLTLEVYYRYSPENANDVGKP